MQSIRLSLSPGTIRRNRQDWNLEVIGLSLYFKKDILSGKAWIRAGDYESTCQAFEEVKINNRVLCAVGSENRRITKISVSELTGKGEKKGDKVDFKTTG